jgi:hypothetical protein
MIEWSGKCSKFLGECFSFWKNWMQVAVMKDGQIIEP